MSNTIKCPFCAEEIKAEAKKCKHCGEWLTSDANNQVPLPKSDTKVENDEKKGSNTASGCIGLLIIAVLLWVGVRSCSNNNSASNSTQEPSGVATSNENTASSNESQQSAGTPSEKEIIRIKEKLENSQLQTKVYNECQEKQGDFVGRPKTAQWPPLDGGLFSGMRRNIDTDAQTLTLRAAVKSQDNFNGDVETIVDCIYSLNGDKTTAKVEETRLPSKYTVALVVNPDQKSKLTITQTSDKNAVATNKSVTKDSDRRKFNLKPGSYKFEVQRFGYENFSGTFKVPSSQIPTAVLKRLPTVRVHFTSLPNGINVRLSNGTEHVTPFDISLPKNTPIKYEAFTFSEDINYELQEETIEFSKNATHRIELVAMDSNNNRTVASNESQQSSLNESGSDAAVSETTYPVNFKVTPATATVKVKRDELFGESFEARGPNARFDLTAGDYTYTISSPLNKEAKDSFSVPKRMQFNVKLEKEYLEAGNGIDAGDWLIQGGWKGQGVKFYTEIGDEFVNDSSDSGYVFALVPVIVQSNTKSTKSFSYSGWELRDEKGNTYTLETLAAEFYLDANQRLDTIDVPPGAARSGFLVFQVANSVQDLYLIYDRGFNTGTWHFKTN